MAFATEERSALLARVRYELGYSAVTQTGEPYIGWTLAPDIAVDNLETGAETTSATAVTSTTAPTEITLSSATGFAAGLRVHVDVGAQREIVVGQSLSGAILSARFAKTHSGTYPVEVESGESMLRTILFKLDDLHLLIQDSFATGGIKRADEVEFFPNGSALKELFSERQRWRNELASLLKLPNLHDRGTSGRLEAY